MKHEETRILSARPGEGLRYFDTLSPTRDQNGEENANASNTAAATPCLYPVNLVVGWICLSGTVADRIRKTIVLLVPGRII